MGRITVLSSINILLLENAESKEEFAKSAVT